MEQLYLKDPYKITFASLGDRDQKNRGRNFAGGNNHYRRERRKEYKDFDEPESEKGGKTNFIVKPIVNFLDI